MTTSCPARFLFVPVFGVFVLGLITFVKPVVVVVLCVVVGVVVVLFFFTLIFLFIFTIFIFLGVFMERLFPFVCLVVNFASVLWIVDI